MPEDLALRGSRGADGHGALLDLVIGDPPRPPRYSKFLWLGVALIPLVILWIVLTSYDRVALAHKWQDLHAWPQYWPHGCDAVHEGYLAARAGDRQGAIERFREARWQWDRNPSGPHGSDAVQTVTRELERGMSPPAVASQVLYTPELRYCARHGYWS